MFRRSLIFRLVPRSFLGPTAATKSSFQQFSTLTKAEKSTGESADSDTFQAKVISDRNAFRGKQLMKLEAMDSATFNESTLLPFIAEFLVKQKPADFDMAERLLERFVFTVKGCDRTGELSTLFLVQLLVANQKSRAFRYLARLLAVLEENSTALDMQAPRFMLEYAWEAVLDSVNENDAELVYGACRKAPKTLATIGFKLDIPFMERLLTRVYVPRLAWPQIDGIIADSVSTKDKVPSIGVSGSVLAEIFNVVIHPDYDDLAESACLAQPRFHRLLALLNRWKAAGIPVKGNNVAEALKLSFMQFAPSDAILSELELI